MTISFAVEFFLRQWLEVFCALTYQDAGELE
jgi:hypothetical protein